MRAVRIQTLGSLRLWLNDELVPDKAWPTQKSRQLFEILLVNYGRLVPTDKLMEYLWPELSVKRARNNLWVSIGQARRVLEPDLAARAPSKFILKQGDGYKFQPNQDCWIDLEVFQESIAHAQDVASSSESIEHLQTAIDLYQGELLAHDPYAEWAIQPRRQLSEAFLNASLELASAYAYQGEFRHSVELCRRCLGFDNSRESTYRALMLYLYCAGEQSEAIRVYEEAQQKLLEEIGAEPTLKTKFLLQQIQSKQVIGVDVDRKYPLPDDRQSELLLLSQMPLVGRSQELGQLTNLVHQLQDGHSQLCLVTGESGIGKSRLLQEMNVWARQEDLFTHAVSCYQVEKDLLYEPLIDLTRQVHQAQPNLVAALAPVWRRELGFLIPEIVEPPHQDPRIYSDETEAQQGRLFQAVLQYLRLAARESGLIITFEDIQWTDEGTLQFLHYLGGRIDESGILLCLSCRQEDRSADPQLASFLHHLQRLPTTMTIQLNRLTKSDLDMLLRSQSNLPDGWASWLHNETLGNPYFLISILQSLVEQQLVPDEQDEQSQPPSGLSLPQSIKESIKDRLRLLEARERVILEWIAVYGRPLDFQTLRAISGQESSALLEIVDHLLQRNFLLEGVDGIEFSHHKVAEFLYDELSGIRKIVSHQKIGQTLSDMSKNAPALLAYHFAQAGETELAITYWLQAGRAALNRYALRLATSHYRSVLEIAEKSLPRLEAYIGLGHALTLLDEVDDAGATLQAGIALSEEVGDKWRRVRLGFHYAQLFSRQHPSDAAAVEIRRALQLANQIGDETLVARLLLLLSVAQSSEGMLSDSLESLIRARALSKKENDQHLEAKTLNQLGFIYTQLGDFKKGVEVTQTALALPPASIDQGISTYALNILGRAYGGSGEYQLALNVFGKCKKQAEAIEDRFFMAQVPNMLGWLYRELYAFELAEQYDQESVDLAVRYNKRSIEISARLNHCMDWLGMHHYEDAYNSLNQIEELVKAGQFGFHQWRWRLRLLHIWGRYHLQTGQAELALANSEKLRDLAQEMNVQKYICLAQQLRGDSLVLLDEVEPAANALERAVQLANSISYSPVLWEASYQLARSRPKNRQEILLEARSKALETAGQLSDPDLQQGFLNSPTIQAVIGSQNNPT